MKKNLALFGILVLLIGAAYLFQEKRVEEQHREADDRDRLMPSEITELKLPNFTAIKTNGIWRSGELQLSHNQMKIIETKLSQIRKVKVVGGAKESYFPNPVQFEVNKTVWKIGDLSLERDAFYIGNDNNIYLAWIAGESTQLTSDEKEIESSKLNELVSAISKPLDEMKETQVFRFYPGLPLERIMIENDDHLPFELDLAANQTLPPPIPGIHVHSDLRGKFYSQLTQMMMKQEVPFASVLKFAKLASITFLSGPKKVRWDLYLRSGKSADAYLVDAEAKRAWLMIGGSLKLFFISLQDYWDKKVIPQEHFGSFSRLALTFSQGNKKAEVTVINKEPLDFEAKSFRIEKTQMDALMHFIFNLGPRDQGDRVSQLSSSERTQLLSEGHLRLSVMGQELLLWRKTQELIIVNLTQGYKVHFSLLDENFHAIFEDVLK